MKKKVFALLLAAVMLLSLAACGGGSGSGSGSGSGDDGSGGSSDSGKTVLNLWAFTDEVPKMVDKFLANHPGRDGYGGGQRHRPGRQGVFHHYHGGGGCVLSGD